MCPQSIVLWCFVLLLVASFSESREHSTSGDEQSNNSTVQYEFLVDSMKYRHDEMKPILCNSRKISIKNDDEMQYKFHINSTKNDDSMRYESRGHIKNREESNQMFMESRPNSTENFNESFTKTEDESNSTSYEFGNTDDYNNSGHVMATIVSYKACNNVTCIQLCCPFGDRLTRRGRCVAGLNNYSFPDVYKCDNDSEVKTLDELFQLTVRDPCVRPGFRRRLLHPKTYWILPNGFLYQGPDKLILSSSYCLAIFNRNIYDVFTCTSQRVKEMPIYLSAFCLVSLLFLLLTFVVYSILPELQNIHGYTLCALVASLFIVEVIIYMGHKLSGWVTKNYCIPLAYFFHFSFLSSFFWLNIMYFDIWWTFRRLRSCRISINRKKKKFVIYSIYAWGIPFILTVVCAIIDNAPGIPKDWILPDICRKRFWLGEHWAKIIYFFIPVSATIITNIFFIATAVTILYQNRDAHQLRDSESRRHDENKQRFNMYLKLFIVLGITWVMQLIMWVINDLPNIVQILSDLINLLQNVIFFIVFVCNKKIKQLLLKRFGGQNCGPFCKISINHDNMVSNTTSTSALGTVSMQERPVSLIVSQSSINPHSTAM